jgi:hypothetical protein
MTFFIFFIDDSNLSAQLAVPFTVGYQSHVAGDMSWLYSSQ